MYNKETIQDAGYKYKKRIDRNSVYLWNESSGQAELWIKSPHYSGYTIVIGKSQYEYCHSNPDIRYCEECERWEEK